MFHLLFVVIDHRPFHLNTFLLYPFEQFVFLSNRLSDLLMRLTLRTRRSSSRYRARLARRIQMKFYREEFIEHEPAKVSFIVVRYLCLTMWLWALRACNWLSIDACSSSICARWANSAFSSEAKRRFNSAISDLNDNCWCSSPLFPRHALDLTNGKRRR